MDVYDHGHMPAFSDMTVYEAQYALYDQDVADMAVEPPDFMLDTIEDLSSETDNSEPDYASYITEWKTNTEYLVVKSATHIIPPADVTPRGSPLAERQIVLMIPSDNDPANVHMITVRVLSVEEKV